MKSLTIAAVCVLAATPAFAETTRWPDAKDVVIEDFTGAVIIERGSGALTAEIVAGPMRYPVETFMRDGALVIAGEERPRNFQLWKELDYKKHQDKALARYLQDYPRLTISIPAGGDIAFDDAITIANITVDADHAMVDGGHVEAVFADANSADIAIDGAGDIAMSHVAGALEVSINGSGDFKALSAGEAALGINGSGDISVGPVARDGRVSISGSGDVDVASIGGAAEFSIHGSGDVLSGPVAKGASFSIAGSGDIAVDRINGPARASIAGNGDIGIGAGRAENLKVSIAGSGDFTFGGVSTNLDVSIIGSGAVSVSDNEGDLHYSENDGDLYIGGKRITKRD